MKQINSFDDCLDYVSHLGVVNIGQYPEWIPRYQQLICEVCDKILHQSGQDSWYHVTFKPFMVKYSRKSRGFTVKQV